MEIDKITTYQKEECLCGKNYFVPDTKLARRLNLSVKEVRELRKTISSDIIFTDEDSYWRCAQWSKRKTKTLV